MRRLVRAVPLQYVGLALLAGCSGTAVNGTLTDGLFGTPVAGVEVLLKAADDVPFSCQVFSARTDDAGSFVVEGVCLSKTDYRISIGDGSSYFIADDAILTKGGDGSGSWQAYNAPEGSGMYELDAEGVLTPLPTHADVRRTTVLNTDETVEYPSTLPAEEDIPLIGAGEFLVVVGEDNLATAAIKPLVKSGPQRFGNQDSYIQMQDWWYIGISFDDEGEHRRQAAIFDASVVVEKTRGSRAARFIPGHGLPSGRYAIRESGSRRITSVDFGAPPVDE